MNTGYLAALGTIFTWTIATFIFARLSRLEESHVLNKASLFLSIFLLGLVVCLLDRLTPWELFTIPKSYHWLWLGISGIIGKSLGDYCGYRAFRILGPRRRTMITTLTPGFTWLFGLVILNETMNWLGIAAIIITSGSLLLLINSDKEKNEVKEENYGLPGAGLLLGIAGAALTALAFNLSKIPFIENGRNISEFHGTWIRIVTAFAFLVIFDTIRNKNTGFIRQFWFDKRKRYLLFFGVLFGSVLGLSFLLMAVTRMNVAKAYTIISLVPVSVILVSVMAFKKKISMKSWVYSVLAVAGVLLLVWKDR